MQGDAGVKEALQPAEGSDQDPYYALMLSSGPAMKDDRSVINSLG